MDSVRAQLDETSRSRLKRLLDAAVVNPDSSIAPAIQKAVLLARGLQEKATALQTPEEKKQQAELERMMQRPRDKATLTQLTDQAFRSADPERAVDQLVHILDIQGVPRFFSPVERTLLRGFQSFGSYLPGVAVPLVKDKMREETANVILPAEHDLLAPHLSARKQSGMRMNVNYVGEALLGEAEAERRLALYLHALQLPEIEVISVKISTLYSQISTLAADHTLNILCDRLELLYRAAAKHRFERFDGSVVPKFVYLDMEEYRDAVLTAEAFMRTLSRPGLEHASAGIALQAYLPDSFALQKQINVWARARAAAGGAPVTIRIVKGANMEMERVDASIHGWPQPILSTKKEVDANYKRMLHEAFKAENIKCVHVGIASHNLFDVAYGLIRAAEQEILAYVQFEMLEGMANHQRRALFEVSSNLLLYAPATRKENFINAIGYLIRRLDENTGPDNFLRHAFKVTVDSPEWKRLEAGFVESFSAIETLPETPRRTQSRLDEVAQTEAVDHEYETFKNEPDTDFCLSVNVSWAKSILEDWEARQGDRALDVPLVVDGKEIFKDREVRHSSDPSRPDIVVAHFRHATSDDADHAVACAKRDQEGWRSTSAVERSELLARVADQLRRARAELMGAALADGGKTLTESDAEVSEAIDFAEYYRRSAVAFERLRGVEQHGKGVVVIVSPWNFPIAIPCGGIAAALAAGNNVILKPASDSALVAYTLCACFWRAGISKQVLQFMPAPGRSVGAHLVAHKDVDAVILTGGTETALHMLGAQPDMDLFAETGGKNATIVTALSDREQAIKHIIHSAFSHSGQKCSATSLLILEEEVYDDPRFKETLCDAVESLTVGSAWKLENRVGPMIRPPSGDLERALKELEPGESWAVLPRQLEGNPCLYSPGVKWDVQPGSYTHTTEFFGPVLGVMKAKSLHEAVQFVRRTGYGLTSGLESLDDREQKSWLDQVPAGNLYINRVTTGAIVLRQPFGGMGKSAFGPGIKAGGPNYVSQFMRFDETDARPRDRDVADSDLQTLKTQLAELARARQQLPPAELRRVVAAIESYDEWMEQEFGVQHDDVKLVGQDNIRRYRSVDELRIRLHPDDTLFDLYGRVCAAKTAGCRITVSVPPGFRSPALDALRIQTEPWGAAIEFVDETDDALTQAIRDLQTERVRYAAPERAPMGVLQAAHESALYVARTNVVSNGRIELLWYVREQSISNDYHRYGNLGLRASEKRAEVL